MEKEMAKHSSGAGRGMARGLADYLEIPPELAERAGEPALAALMEIKNGVDAGSGDLRQVHLCHAQNHMSRLDPYRHGTLLQHLQALVVSLGGRRGDTHIAHVTPGEVVLGDDLMTPDVVDLLRRTAKEKGLDYERFVVGSGRNSINPHTGQMEFYDGGDDENSADASGQADANPPYYRDADGTWHINITPAAANSGAAPASGNQLPPLRLGNLPDPSSIAKLPSTLDLPPINTGTPPTIGTAPPQLGVLSPSFAAYNGLATPGPDGQRPPGVYDPAAIPNLTVTAQRPDVFADSNFQTFKTGVIRNIDSHLGGPGDFAKQYLGIDSPYLPTTDRLNDWAFSMTPRYDPPSAGGKLLQDQIATWPNGLVKKIARF
jgi:hypothetical protein